MEKHNAPLRNGFTTGSCAAAAAKGAASMLAQQKIISKVSITLPLGQIVDFELHGQSFTPENATCFVIKDAGDDPDITNGAHIHATVTNEAYSDSEIKLTGGVGIGKITKPGLAIPPGEYAINPVPRKMIAQALQDFLSPEKTLRIELSIPDGEERAKKTLNKRLGIIGGLSILGTTGIVRPISTKAWTDTVDASLDVALACNCKSVVLSTGRSSELAAQKYIQTLSEEGYIMMGDHVAHTLKSCQNRNFLKPIITSQFAKLLKIACGYENTHAASSVLDLRQLADWCSEENFTPSFIQSIVNANTAREVIDSSNFDKELISLVCRRAEIAVKKHANRLTPQFLLTDYNKTIVFAS